MHFRLVPKSMTLNDLEWPKRTSAEKNLFYGAHQKNLNKDKPILSAAKTRVMSLIFRNIRYMWLFARVPRCGGVKRQWVVKDGNFDRSL